MEAPRPKILSIVGTTASGKSDLAVELALQFDGEVISADSRQVYKGLDIGTGKITKKEMRGVPHHMLDVVDPNERFSVANFVSLGTDALISILERGKLPIIAGGTGMYVEALLGGISLPAVPPDHTLRQKLDKKTAEALFAELTEKDPERAARIDPKNKRRVIRALEIVAAIGTVPSVEAGSPYKVLTIGLFPKDDVLRERIKVRLEKRIGAGMIEEAEHLHKNGLSYARMRELGLEYRYLADLLEKKIDRDTFTEQLETAIWQYAKRQRTWWQAHKPDHTFTSPDDKKIPELVRTFLGR